jgi:hypothetical protein
MRYAGKQCFIAEAFFHVSMRSALSTSFIKQLFLQTEVDQGAIH